MNILRINKPGRINYRTHITGMLKVFSIPVFLFFITGCVGIKPAAMKTGKKAFETFYLGDGKTQYFIKPLVFKGQEGGSLIMDITFRYKNDYLDTATVNISIIEPSPIRQIESVQLINGASSNNLNEIEILFTEKKDKNVLSRFTSVADMQAIVDFLSNDENELEIIMAEKNRTRKYYAPKKTRKVIGTLEDYIFSIL